MSTPVKTLNSVQSIAAPSPVRRARTYSVEPNVAPQAGALSTLSPSELASFLEAENPLGCFRGVMWVMAFNGAVFLLGFMIWQSCKFLL